jgi:glycosyltransferase involved in cell wall biosynthesis
MRIGMILLSATGFPPDIRVEKECQALSKAGHEVFVMTVAQSKPDVGSSLYLEDLEATVCNAALMPKSLRVKLLNRLLITNRYWADAIEKFIVDHKIDVIHAHDLYALPPSVAAAKKLGRPVVADLHENMPAACRAYRDWYPLHKKWLSRVIYNYHWMRWRESRLLKQCTHIIIVVPEASRRLEEYGIDLNIVSVVSNTEDETTFKVEYDSIDENLLEKYKDRFVVSYIGGVGPHRGIETSLQAVKFAKERIPNLLFLVVGVRSPDHLQRIGKEVGRP